MAAWQKWLFGIVASVVAGFIMAATGQAIEVLRFQSAMETRLDRVEDKLDSVDDKVDEINRHLRNNAGH